MNPTMLLKDNVYATKIAVHFLIVDPLARPVDFMQKVGQEMC